MPPWCESDGGILEREWTPDNHTGVAFGIAATLVCAFSIESIISCNSGSSAYAAISPRSSFW
jgi:hypothetical protein